MIDFTELLKAEQLSLTKSRLRLLKILADTGFPVSGKEIEERIKGKCDRATIYRNLNVLSSRGIIQRVLSGNSVKFKFDPRVTGPEAVNDHVHFQCSICQKVICLEEVLISDYPLPEGYTKSENQFLIIGKCRNCNGAEQI